MPDERPFPLLDEPVTIELGDGVQHPLVYDLMTLRRCRKRLGSAIVGPRGAILTLDESCLPELIFEGMCDPDGNPPAGVTIERLLKMPASSVSYLTTKFSTAYAQAHPQKKTGPAQPTK